ncbi:MAG: hypothetical protein Tsb0013_04640 [Phycisphaerales bacterium]
MSHDAPHHDALPDDVLLDLVEGKLRASDVERVRAALKGDPKLASRLEAMRTDRRTMMSLSDPGVGVAPAGLVADAMAIAERSDLLVAPAPAPSGSLVRRLTPALLAACVGVVAVAGWYAYSQGLLFAPTPPTSTGAPPGADGATDRPVFDGPTIDGPTLVEGPTVEGGARLVPQDRSLAEAERRMRPFELAKEVGGPLPGSFGVLTEPAPDAALDPSVSGAMGEPVAPDLLAGGDDSTDPWSGESVRRSVPEAVVPEEAAAWAREGALAVVLSPADEDTDTTGFARDAARRLAIVYDPSMAGGWGVTRVPSIRPTAFAGDAPPSLSGEPATPRADDEHPILISISVDAGASDGTLQEAIASMARRLRAITGYAVRLDRLPDGERIDTGRVAMTADTLLWWKRPAEQWTPRRVFHVPVVTPE